MNINDILKVGEIISKEYIVKTEDTADFIGNKGVNVLSTPAMIGLMEETASLLILGKLPDGFSPVGTKINIEHINATPIKMKITINAEVIAIDGNKVCYKVEVYNEKCKIGFGDYEQRVINLERFLNKQYKK